jgi:hypothetical protein
VLDQQRRLFFVVAHDLADDDVDVAAFRAFVRLNRFAPPRRSARDCHQEDDLFQEGL